MTWDGRTIRAYVNGIQQGSGSMTGNPNTSGFPLQIGTVAGSYLYAGYEDNLRVYNRALSPAEIQALYNATK
jgi:Concanavalin A-like lectin/glucanases superfamily